MDASNAEIDAIFYQMQDDTQYAASHAWFQM